MERTAAQLRRSKRRRCQLEPPEALAEGLILELGWRGGTGARYRRHPQRGLKPSRCAAASLHYTTPFYALMHAMLWEPAITEWSISHHKGLQNGSLVLACVHVYMCGGGFVVTLVRSSTSPLAQFFRFHV